MNDLRENLVNKYFQNFIKSFDVVGFVKRQHIPLFNKWEDQYADVGFVF